MEVLVQLLTLATALESMRDLDVKDVRKRCSFLLDSTSSKTILMIMSTAICFPPDGCRNGGVCIRPGHCSCSTGWEGVRCDERKSVAIPSSPIIHGNYYIFQCSLI